MNSVINLINKDQIVYIPAYVEQGIEKLEDAQDILEDISKKIERGISRINSSGYNRGIPYIEKGDVVSSAVEQMQNTISVITRELEKYNDGKVILGDDAIIIADPNTARRYNLDKERINYTLDEYYEKYGVNPKWDSNFLTAAVGSIKYYGADGRLTKETWCDLDPSNLATLMRKQGIDLDFWIREDGVYMYGDYVMVAADIPHMDGTEQAAEYRKGDLVETSLGTGMVVDLCGMAEMVRKGELKGTAEGDVEVWYDIYTAWHEDGEYHHVGYCNDEACISSHTTGKTMISASQSNGGQTTLSVPTSLTSVSASTEKSLTDVIKDAIIDNPVTEKLSEIKDTLTNNPATEKISEIKSNISSTFSFSDNTQTTQTQTTTNNTNNLTLLGEKINNFIANNLTDNQTTTQSPTESFNKNSMALAGSLSKIASSYENTTTSKTSENDYVIPRINEKPGTRKIETGPFLEGIGLAAVAGISTKIYIDSKKDEDNDEEDIPEEN